MQCLVMTIRCWYVYGRSWIIGSMSVESPRVGIWYTCKVRTETLRDTLSSGTNLSSMSAMVTDLQTHETPEGLLTCPVYIFHGRELFVIFTFLDTTENIGVICKRLMHMGLSSVSIRTLLTVLNYRTSNDPLYVRFEINFLL